MKKIKLEKVSKAYGQVQALDQVSLILEEGKIYGLLGRNGAGKTTMINCITDFVFPDEGTITMEEDGKPIVDPGTYLYRTSEHTYYPEGMLGKEVIKWTSKFYPTFDSEQAHQLAEEFQVDLNKKISALSTGQNSLLKAIIALSVHTPFLLLDEPTLGMDAYNREMFYKKILEAYGEQPFGLLLSTHLIEEVSNLIEEVIIII